MGITTRETMRRRMQDDLADTRRLIEGGRKAQEVSLRFGRPTVLLHNCVPGSVAGCIVDILVRGDPFSVGALHAGRAILQMASDDAARSIMRAISIACIEHPGHDHAAQILMRAFDIHGTEIAS